MQPIESGTFPTKKPRIRSVEPIDRETVDLVEELLAGGYEPKALAVALTVDDDTLRRWRRGVPASHGYRKLMRCIVVLRKLAPGLLSSISFGGVPDLLQAVDALTVRHLTPADVKREAVPTQLRLMRWADGAERAT